MIVTCARRTLVALAGTLTLAAVAPATVGPTAIYTEIAASPTSDVPGLPGHKWENMFRPYRSQDGSRFIMNGDSNQATTSDEFILIGTTALPVTGSAVVQEGVTSIAGELVGLIRERMGINNNAGYAFSTNTSATVADEIIVAYDPNLPGFVVVAREGDAVAGVADPNEKYGGTLDLGNILPDGTVAFRAPGTAGPLPATQDEFCIVGSTILAQAGVTAPTGAVADPNDPNVRTWDIHDAEDFQMDGTGANYLIKGDLTLLTTTDDVITVNNAVVLQELQPVPGGGAVASAGATEAYMSVAGAWMARGTYSGTAPQDDWIVRNGALLVRTGNAVPCGRPGEILDDTLFTATFFYMIENANGDIVYGGTTNEINPDEDAVLVWLSTSGLRYPILRQGMPVDVNGNGQFDDNAFINIFNNDDGFLTDDNVLFTTVDLRDSVGTALGQALIRFRICQGDADNDGDVDQDDLDLVLFNFGATGLDCRTNGDVDGDGDADQDDLDLILFNFGCNQTQ